MRIVCPQCHAAYQVDAVIKNAILVCHRCNTEFDTFGNAVTANNPSAEIFKQQEANAPTFGLYDLVQTGAKSRGNYLWLFMFIVLFIIALTGFTLRWDHWQFNSYVRAYQLKTNLMAPVLERDWHILPDTVKAHWLNREDQSLVLLIEGQVESLVSIALPPPEITVTFVTQTGKNIDITQAITEPADLATLKTVPFASPTIDKVPVSPQGRRGFLLLIEDAPISTQHILLHASAVQRRGSSNL